MTEQRMKITTADDKSSVTIEYLPASGVTGSMTLVPEQLLKLIHGLGAVRANLVADQPIPSLEGQQINVIFNTRWFVQPALMGEASVLTFHHPAFGPLGFAIPIDQVGLLVSLLTNHLNQAEADRQAPQ